MNSPEILVLGTADWDAPIATNQHYLARELSSAYGVLFSESIGLRRPTFARDDFDRIVHRLRPGPAVSTSSRMVPDRLSVVTPKVIPIHAPWTRRINSVLLRSAVASWVETPAPKVLWTYTPVTYGLEDRSSLAVYHCVDLLGEVVGIDKAVVERGERRLAAKGVVAIGSSQVVVEHLHTIGFREVIYWPNVADTAVIKAQQPDCPRRTARALFAGRVTGDKVDFAILHAILKVGVPLAIAGPVGGDRDQIALERLISAGADYLGHLEFGALAQEYWQSKVGLVPYPVNAYTTGVSPLKLYEYLAAGLAVVSTPLPEMRRLGILGVAVREDPIAFADAVRSEVDGFTEDASSARVALAQANSWDTRGEAARSIVKPSLGA